MYVAVTVIAAMLLGIGFVLQQHAAEELPGSYFLRLRLFAELLRKPLWLGGILTMLAGDALSAWTLGHLSLSVSEPLLTTSLLFALLLAVPISGKVPNKTELAGAVLLSAGLAALSVSRSVRGTAESFGSYGHWPVAAIIAAVAAGLVAFGRRGPAIWRATLTGAASGLIFGIADAMTRRSFMIMDARGPAALLGSWPAYGVAVATVVGLWLMESAFTAGPLHASLPAITAGEPLAGIVLGVVVFGDVIHVSPWLLALQVAGLAAVVAGVVLVARAPAFGRLGRRPRPLARLKGPPKAP